MQDLTAILVQLTRIADALERAYPVASAPVVEQSEETPKSIGELIQKAIEEDQPPFEPDTTLEPTHEDLAECFKALMRKDKAYKPLLKNLLDGVGAARTSEVKPDDIVQLIKSAEALTL